eukprot:1186134-Prorocentrum_minimum.AAC.5
MVAAMVAAQQHRRAPYPYPEKRMDDDDKRLRFRGAFAFLRRLDPTIVGFAVVGVILLVLSLYGVYELLLQDDDAFDGGQASEHIEYEISQQSNLTEINNSVQADLEASVKEHISQLLAEGLQSNATRVKGKTPYEAKILDSIYNAMQVRERTMWQMSLNSLASSRKVVPVWFCLLPNRHRFELLTKKRHVIHELTFQHLLTIRIWLSETGEHRKQAGRHPEVRPSSRTYQGTNRPTGDASTKEIITRAWLISTISVAPSKTSALDSVEGTQLEVGATDSDSSGAGTDVADALSAASAQSDEGLDSFGDKTDYAQYTGDVRRIQVHKPTVKGGPEGVQRGSRGGPEGGSTRTYDVCTESISELNQTESSNDEVALRGVNGQFYSVCVEP